MKRNLVAGVASLALALGTAAPAVAATSPTCGTYVLVCSSINSASHSTTTTTTATTGTGSLPFTGLDVGLLVAGGGSLAGLGFIIRRTSNRSS
jgi:hypothetical protein